MSHNALRIIYNTNYIESIPSILVQTRKQNEHLYTESITVLTGRVSICTLHLACLENGNMFLSSKEYRIHIEFKSSCLFIFYFSYLSISLVFYADHKNILLNMMYSTTANILVGGGEQTQTKLMTIHK